MRRLEFGHGACFVCAKATNQRNQFGAARHIAGLEVPGNGSMLAAAGLERLQQVIGDCLLAGVFEPLLERQHRQRSKCSSATMHQQVVGAFHEVGGTLRLHHFADAHLVAGIEQQMAKAAPGLADCDATACTFAGVEGNGQRRTFRPDAEPLQLGNQRRSTEDHAGSVFRFRAAVPDASQTNGQEAMAARGRCFLLAFVDAQLDGRLRQQPEPCRPARHEGRRRQTSTRGNDFIAGGIELR